MDEFLVKLQKLKLGIFSRLKLLCILEIIIIFCIFYSIFMILNMEYFINKTTFYIPFPVSFIPPILALFFGAAIALILHRKDNKINIPFLIEQKNSELKEKLRTAYDNREEANIILDTLKSEVSGVLDKVSSEHIITTGKLIFMLIITVGFFGGTTMIALNHERYAIPVTTIEDMVNIITGNSYGGGNETLGAVGDPEDFGKAGGIETKTSIATIEGKNIDLMIFPGYEQGYELKAVSQTHNPFIASATFPVDVLGSNVSDGGYSMLMKKTESEKQLINQYAVKRSTI